MITAIAGTLEACGDGWVIVSVGGVSLRLQVPSSAVEALGATGSSVRLYTHLQVTEESLYLYGFTTEAGQRLFQMLIGVGGVGPRAGLGLLSALSPEEAAAAIASEDADTLARAPGIGRKTAGRIILELRGKLEREGIVPKGSPLSADNEVVAALTALGYSGPEVRQAVRGLDDASTTSLEDRIRLVLQRLARD